MASETETEAARWLATAEERMGRNEARVRAGFWPKLKRFAASLPLAEEFVAAYYAAFDRNTPTRVRALLLGALAYFILPVDLFPDLLIGIGFTDDITVLIMAFKAIRSHVKPEHRDAARRAVAEIKAGIR